MKRRGWLSKLVLLPISKIYGIVTFLRNWMFNVKILKDKEFDVPVIVVGNIAAGGTGKTPHVEYLVDTFRHEYHLAVVSRGYRRATKGFVMATRRSTPKDIGDEPYQIYQKFNGEVTVVVCEDRVAGIEELLRIDPNINLLILDDAFQHRYVKPTVAIVLTEYNRPVFNDHLLPYGNLRESKSELQRADIVIATKCPEKVTAIDYRIFEQNLNLVAWQKTFFSKFVYTHLKPVFPDDTTVSPPSLEWLDDKDALLVVAGIGNPRPFVKYIKHFRPAVRVNLFPDHHNFTRKDMDLISQRFSTMTGRHKFLITTEKDAVRMVNCPYFPHELKAYSFYLPINVEFTRDGASPFIEHVRKMLREKSRKTKS